VEFDRSILRTAQRDSFHTRAISRVDTAFAFSSSIVVRCAWLSMLVALFLSDSLFHPVQFVPRAFDLALRLFLPLAVHLGQGFGEPPAGTLQDGNGHLQIALECGRGWSGGGRLPLRFQKQFRLGEDALSSYA
jgi:hypothetical protein